MGISRQFRTAEIVVNPLLVVFAGIGSRIRDQTSSTISIYGITNIKRDFFLGGVIGRYAIEIPGTIRTDNGDFSHMMIFSLGTDRSIQRKLLCFFFCQNGERLISFFPFRPIDGVIEGQGIPTPGQALNSGA